MIIEPNSLHFVSHFPGDGPSPRKEKHVVVSGTLNSLGGAEAGGVVCAPGLAARRPGEFHGFPEVEERVGEHDIGQ